jgi:hypothetical protein
VLAGVTPGVSALLRNVVLPHAQIFAILIGVGDLAIGISLSLGLFTRLSGMLAILRGVTNILVAGGAGPDTVTLDPACNRSEITTWQIQSYRPTRSVSGHEYSRAPRTGQRPRTQVSNGWSITGFGSSPRSL